ncbi:hypothetical protein MASR2M78_31780 [Treponema sp.]
MQESNQVVQQDEDEISLIDLLVVLLKHRYLIIGTTLLTAIAAGIILFALPLAGAMFNKTYTVQASVILTQIPAALNTETGLDAENLAIAYSQDLQAVAERVIAQGLRLNGSKAHANDAALRNYLSSSFIGKAYTVSASKNILTYKLTAKDAEAAKAFITDSIDYADMRLRTELASRSTLIAKTMGDLYNNTIQYTSISESAKQLIISSRSYMEGTVPLLLISSQPELVAGGQGRSKTAIIVVMAAFFLSIFTAFVVEYVQNVRADPESWDKIKKALGKA